MINIDKVRSSLKYKVQAMRRTTDFLEQAFLSTIFNVMKVVSGIQFDQVYTSGFNNGKIILLFIIRKTKTAG